MTTGETATREKITLLRSALGPVEHLRLTHAEYLEAMHSLAWFVGEPLDSVVFLSEVPQPAATAHRMHWLRGKTFGSFTIGAHEGAMGEDGAIKVTGRIRLTSSIEWVELKSVEVKSWRGWGDMASPDSVPDLLPSLVVHFTDGDNIDIDFGDRRTEPSRRQAAAFVEALQAELAS